MDIGVTGPSTYNKKYLRTVRNICNFEHSVQRLTQQTPHPLTQGFQTQVAQWVKRGLTK